MPTTTFDAFEGANIEYATLHVPDTSVNAYSQAEPWKNFKEIVALTDSDPKPTGINAVEASVNDKGTIYDLNGRRIEQPTKGVYIKNGKKYVVR